MDPFDHPMTECLPESENAPKSQQPGPEIVIVNKLETMLHTSFSLISDRLDNFANEIKGLPTKTVILLRTKGDVNKEDPSYPSDQEHRAQITRRDSQFDHFSTQQQQWQQDINDLKRQNSNLATTLEQKEAELNTATANVSRLRQKESQFRKMILEKAGTQKVSDQEVKDKFLGLRQRSQAIANGNYFDLGRIVKPKDEQYLFSTKLWADLPPTDRKNRLNAEIYMILHKYILDAKCFGLDGCFYGKKKFPRHLESDLSDFETYLEEMQVDDQLIQRWRFATIDCANRLDNASATVRRIVDKIAKFCEPVVIRNDRARDTFKQELTLLCKDAFDLRMILRRSEDGYRCEVVPSAPDRAYLVSNWDYLVEPQGVEEGKNNQASDEIAYTLFGALTKLRGDGEEGRRPY
ncbi:hypothetical protein TruAng_009602 [Truncatella angustata]|nr:hypothetical protein TruAng_009602 [Truncatella angustata]